MDNEYAEQVLKEFVERDRMLRENSVESDYDKFCEATCRAIETILAENEELKSKYIRALNDLAKAMKEKNELKEEMRILIKKEKLALKLINFDTADDRDYIIRILDELLGEEK